MTKEEINKMVEQAGFHGMLSIGVVMDVNQLEAFAKLVAEHERDECLKICDEQASGAYWEGADGCAYLIRKRGQE